MSQHVPCDKPIHAPLIMKSTSFAALVILLGSPTITAFWKPEGVQAVAWASSKKLRWTDDLPRDDCIASCVRLKFHNALIFPI